MFAKRFVFALLAFSLFLAGCGEAKPKTYTVGVIMELAWLAPAYDGFKTSMTELGYVEGQNITYLYSEEVTGGDQHSMPRQNDWSNRTWICSSRLEPCPPKPPKQQWREQTSQSYSIRSSIR